MLSFKEFLNEMFLFEATGKHFSHIAGFDENNPEHQDLVHAFNQSGFPTNHASRIKSMDELKDKVAPKLQALHQARAEEKEHQAAIARGDAELVHHDPEKGIKVFKVKNQAGGCAVGKGTKWCIADPNSPHDMVKHYDPEGKSSHVIHLDKEKGNLSRIGIIGVNYTTPHEEGEGGNFQDKGNNSVSDSDWNHLREKYKLDSIPALHGIRGIAPTRTDKAKLTKMVNGGTRDEKIEASYHPDLTKEHIHTLIGDDDTSVAGHVVRHNNRNITPEHIEHALTIKPEEYESAMFDIHHIKMRELAASHPNASSDNIYMALKDPHSSVREAALENKNLTSDHIALAAKDKNSRVRNSAFLASLNKNSQNK